MAGKRVSSNLLHGASAEVFAVIPVSEEHMGEFVRQGTALPHRVTSARYPDEGDLTHGVAHSQPMLVGARVEDGDIVTRGLFDEYGEITQGLNT